MHEQPVLSEYYGYITHNICHHTRIMSEICSREEVMIPDFTYEDSKQRGDGAFGSTGK